MKQIRRRDDVIMRRNAIEIVRRLQRHTTRGPLRIRQARWFYATDTDGWSLVLGSLGKEQPRLEIWIDRYSNHADRKLWCGFYSPRGEQLHELAHISESHWPVLRLTESDVRDDGSRLRKPLPKHQFNSPILEHYDSISAHYYGYYSSTSEKHAHVDSYFCDLTEAFVLDLTQFLSQNSVEENQPDVYPHCENRKWVASHLRRERSRLLAAQRKQNDAYQCCICDLIFSERYGKELGTNFAEAHHITPLGKLADNVRTELNDLVTVCANCHRMLHRMKGKSSDIRTLRGIVQKHRTRRIKARG